MECSANSSNFVRQASHVKFSPEQLFEWVGFFLLALLFCVFLSLRPIPTVDSPNDTGRYVEGFHEYCNANSLPDLASSDSYSYKIFYLTTSPACVLGSDRTFLIEIASILPLSFLIFSKWRRGTFLWASSALFSVYGVELATNAMRQSLGIFIFLWGMTYARSHRRSAVILCIVGAVAHISVAAYLPLALLIMFTDSNVFQPHKRKYISLAVAILGALGIVATRNALKTTIKAFLALRDFYASIYANHLNLSFIVFMTAPLYLIYSLRRFSEPESVSNDERTAIYYSTALLAGSFILFPAITYRFAIFAVPLQLFLVTRSEKQSLKIGAFVLLIMIIQLFIMLFFSASYSSLFRV